MNWKLAVAGVVVLVVIASSRETSSSNIALEQVSAAAKIYFRDIDELPMKVTVTRTDLDLSGKLKKRSRGSVDFLFHGYNPRSQKGTFTIHYGMFKKLAMKESLAGDAMVLFTGMFLKKEVSDVTSPQVEQPVEEGQPIRVKINSLQCPEFKFQEKMLFPENFCGRVEYRLSRNGGNDLRFQSFSFDSANLPANARIEYLDDVTVLAFHVDEDFQQAFLPNDPKPFLMPRQVVTTISTNKGKIVMTNEYTPKSKKKLGGTKERFLLRLE